MNTYAKANDQYLTQRVIGASPEQLMAILLEGAQRFLAQAEQALAKRDFAAKAKAINRVTAIIEELTLRLNHEEGGELVGNLTRVYDWWGREIIAAGADLDSGRLERVSRQMADLRLAWEQSFQKRSMAGAIAAHGISAGDMVG
jgi:flagellar protein FliS